MYYPKEFLLETHVIAACFSLKAKIFTVIYKTPYVIRCDPTLLIVFFTPATLAFTFLRDAKLSLLLFILLELFL